MSTEPCASQDRPDDDVFRRDQLNLVALAAKLMLDRICNLRIDLTQTGRRTGLRPRWRAAGFVFADVLDLRAPVNAPSQEKR